MRYVTNRRVQAAVIGSSTLYVWWGWAGLWTDCDTVYIQRWCPPPSAACASAGSCLQAKEKQWWLLPVISGRIIRYTVYRVHTEYCTIHCRKSKLIYISSCVVVRSLQRCIMVVSRFRLIKYTVSIHWNVYNILLKQLKCERKTVWKITGIYIISYCWENKSWTEKLSW